MMLVTLDQAKEHLLVDFDDADTDITLKISSASGAVLNYLKTRKKLYQVEVDDDGVEVLDSQGDPVYLRDSQGQRLIRPEVQHATLLLVGFFFRDRDGADPSAWQPGFLPPPVTALLYPLRDPALA